MNILVTGGAGYIGSHTSKALRQAGHTPITVDNLVYGHEWAVKWGPFFKLDLLETEKLTNLMKNEKIEAVIHFAAYAYVGESVREPLKYYQNNVMGSISLFSAMKAAGIRKIIFSSSCATYGIPRESPIHENFAQNPINPYGESKWIGEKILKNLSGSDDFKAIGLRYFNAAGADIDCEIGEDHNPETHVIPLAIEALFDAEKIFTIFGTDYPTKDGTCVRDYVHVTDLADAHVKALESLPKNNSGFWSAYNIGAGQGYSVKDIIKKMESLTGRKLNFREGDRRAGDPQELVADIRLAKQKLNWSPVHSSLDEILQTALHWYEKHHLSQKVRPR